MSSKKKENFSIYLKYFTSRNHIFKNILQSQQPNPNDVQGAINLVSTLQASMEKNQMPSELLMEMEAMSRILKKYSTSNNKK